MISYATLPDAELRQLRAQVGAPAQERIDAVLAARAAPIGKPREPRRGRMNQTEAEYAAKLRADPAFVWTEFEGMKFRLANGSWFTPDFPVVFSDERGLEIHEVKGFWREAARVRIKVAARLYPLTFRAVRKIPKKQGGGWRTETFRGE
jgi:hypothetical protein